MKTTGYIRRIDDLGRITIPREIRRNTNINERDPLEIFLAEDGVLFKKYDYTKPIEDILNNLGDSVNAGNYSLETIQEIHKRISDLRELIGCKLDS